MMLVTFLCEGVGILIISLVGLAGNMAMITNYARRVRSNKRIFQQCKLHLILAEKEADGPLNTDNMYF